MKNECETVTKHPQIPVQSEPEMKTETSFEIPVELECSSMLAFEKDILPMLRLGLTPSWAEGSSDLVDGWPTVAGTSEEMTLQDAIVLHGWWCTQAIITALLMPHAADSQVSFAGAASLVRLEAIGKFFKCHEYWHVAEADRRAVVGRFGTEEWDAWVNGGWQGVFNLSMSDVE